MANLPPINSVVKVIKALTEKDPRLGQAGTVIEYLGHSMVCVHFPDTALTAAMRYIPKSESFDRRGQGEKLYCIIAGSAVCRLVRGFFSMHII